jgi:hypothetical protein
MVERPTTTTIPTNEIWYKHPNSRPKDVIPNSVVRNSECPTAFHFDTDTVCPDRHWTPPSHLYFLYRGSFTGVKRSRCETDHSHASSAEVTNKRSYTSTPPSCPHGNFTIYLTPLCTVQLDAHPTLVPQSAMSPVPDSVATSQAHT